MAMPKFVAESVTNAVFNLKLRQRLQSFTMNGNDSVTETVSKVSDLSYKHESFKNNDSDKVCARVCF